MTVLVADVDLTIHVGDALDVLPTLDASSVDAIVTSPPYADARPDVAAVGLDEFAGWMRPVLLDLLRVVKPSGSLLLNLGRRFRDGEEHPYADDTARAACRVGWRRIDTLVWRKPNANGRGGPYLHDKHEHVFWLAPNVDAYRGYDEHTRKPYDAGTAARYARGFQNAAKGRPRELRPRTLHPLGARPTSVFDCVTGSEKGNPHPTPMPLRLARHLVALSTPLGGCVLDPFAGSGTTGRAALQLGRRTVLIERDPEYAAEAAERCSQLSLLTEGAA